MKSNVLGRLLSNLYDYKIINISKDTVELMKDFDDKLTLYIKMDIFDGDTIKTHLRFQIVLVNAIKEEEENFGKEVLKKINALEEFLKQL